MWLFLVSASLVVPREATVVGGGPAGLAAAIMLKKTLGCTKVTLLDRLKPPPNKDDDTTYADTARFYLIGIGGRGRNALQSLGLWDDVEPYTALVRGRKDWAPGAAVDEGVETIRADRPPSNVIPRDRLVACLLDAARKEGVDIRHEVEVQSVRWEAAPDGGEEVAVLACAPCGEDQCGVDDESASADPEQAYEVRTPLLVGCDGARRTVAEALEAEDAARRWALPGSRFHIKRYEDTSVRVYKTVPFTPPADWRCDINYSARTKLANFDALPTRDGKYCGVLLIKPEDEVTQGLADVAAAREYMNERLPMFSPMVTDDALDVLIKKEPSRLPIWRYAGPRLHRGASTVLLGDAIHTVKPYFGLGVNSALEDVSALRRALETKASRSEALQSFSAERAPEARVLVEISRSFDFGGLRSFISFIGPIILDGIFHSKLPKLFAPNTLAMLQNPDLSFVQIRWRKRADRAAQLAIIGAALAATARIAVFCVFGAIRHVGDVKSPLGASRALLFASSASAAAAAALRRRRARRSGGSDVADLLASQTKAAASKEEGSSETSGTRPGY